MVIQNDARRLSDAWRDHLNLRTLLEDPLRRLGGTETQIDIVALGKASRATAACALSVLEERVGRTFVVTGEASPDDATSSASIVVGEHPTPGEGSLEAGRQLLAFLDDASDATCTLFLVSGGASSLCALPQAPLTLDDLSTIWSSALATGMDITALNQLRAATSQIAGGAVLRHVRTPRSLTLLMVDNVVSGAPWVASGLTYDYRPSLDDVRRLIEVFTLTGDVADRILSAFHVRTQAVSTDAAVAHENVVVAEPALILSRTIEVARSLGYRVIDLGAAIHGDVHDVTERFAYSLRSAVSTGERVCVLGVGEVTVRIRGAGVGGRCQEMAWLMAKVLSTFEREAVFVARATDGQDFVRGVSGGWVDSSTLARCADHGVDWTDVAHSNDSYHGLHALGQLFPGEPTGWNLCDLYFALI